MRTFRNLISPSTTTMPRPKPTGVRGPNSALTAFLRNEGITDAFRRRQEQTPDVTETSATEDLSSEDIQVRPSRRPRAASDDSDSDFEIGSEADSDIDVGRKFGEDDVCVDCGSTFALTVYSRFIAAKKGYLCEECNEALKAREKAARRNQAAARKKRKRLAQALLDRQTVRVASLQDVCIRAITQNIGAVETLGDIGQLNMNKILRILLKNRSLNDSTVALFMSPDIRRMELWDCSKVSSDSLNKIAAYCAHLEELTLFMCGQLHNDNLLYYKDKLPSLYKLALNGPFLISDAIWTDFFKDAQCPLTQFEVRNTHRFGSDALVALLERYGRRLTSLKLSRLDALDTSGIYDLIPEFLGPSTLQELELSYPSKSDIITDDLLVYILAVTGESLRHLNVDGCISLTDKFLSEGVAKFCPNLESLSMKNLAQVTDEGFVAAFTEFSAINGGGLVTVDLTKCTGLGDDAIHALLNHSGHTLVELSLNSLDLLSKPFLMQILTDDNAQWKVSLKRAIEDGVNEAAAPEEQQRFYSAVALPLLTRLDIGFVRAFDDEVATKFGESCIKLNILEVYGDNKCTSKAQLRPEILVIGRQSDAVEFN